MSYNVCLVIDEDGDYAQVEEHRDLGTMKLVLPGPGSTDAKYSITFNYAPHYKQWLDNKQGLNWLHGKKAKDCVERLEKAVEILGTERDEDYWRSTPGNAGYALGILLLWAEQHPEAIFKVYA